MLLILVLCTFSQFLVFFSFLTLDFPKSYGLLLPLYFLFYFYSSQYSAKMKVNPCANFTTKRFQHILCHTYFYIYIHTYASAIKSFFVIPILSPIRADVTCDYINNTVINAPLFTYGNKLIKQLHKPSAIFTCTGVRLFYEWSTIWIVNPRPLPTTLSARRESVKNPSITTRCDAQNTAAA